MEATQIRRVTPVLTQEENKYRDGKKPKPFAARFFESRSDLDVYATFQDRDTSTPYRT